MEEGKMAAMNQNPPTEVPQGGLAGSEMTNKHQADPSENVTPSSPISSCVSMKSHHSMNPPLKFQEPSSSIPRVNPDLPVPSCLSIKSTSSMDAPLKFKSETSQVTYVTPTSTILSCVSMKSHHSMNPPLKFQEPSPSIPRVKPSSPVPSCASIKSDNSMDLPHRFESEASPKPPIIRQERSHTSAPSCASLKSDWSMEQPVAFHKPSEHRNMDVCKMPPRTDVNAISESMLYSADGSPKCSTLPGKELGMTFKSSLINRYQQISDGMQGHGNPTLLSEIYTELYIMEGECGEVNNEHEVRQIETASRIQQSADDMPIKCNDIFKQLQGQDRTVLTKGVAGIGKTISVQKFILDWAEGKANQDIHFIFPLPFRELNLMKDHCLSMEDLLYLFFPQLKEIKLTSITTHNIVFIFDGLDEYRLPLDFRNSRVVSEVNITTSVELLLVNLIKRNLLPCAFIWITSRPAAASQIPHEWISRVTEIRGFNDAQKEEYLRKNVKDERLANDVIKHLRLPKSRSLFIMCHIPVFCWISATVLKKMLNEAESKEIPKTLTQMYTHFLKIQTCIRKKKYNEPQQTDDKEMIMKLGELAFNQLLKGNLIFYEEDLTECGISVRDAVQFSGVCTQIFRKDSDLLHSKGEVFCFVHLSIQEHLAALYVHISFYKGNTTVLKQWNPTKCAITFPCSSLTDLHKTAVDKALQSKSGQFDLFLRFLLGISQESNQALVQMMLPVISACTSQSVQDTIEYIKIRLRMRLNPEKYINLFHCLNELNDSSLEDEIENLLRSRRLAKTKLSTSQWSALVFVLLTSGNARDAFDLRKFSMDNTNECLQRMLPVVMASKTAEVRNCNLSDKGFQALTTALSSKSSSLRELKLSGNVLHQSGIRLLSEGLQSPHCKLDILELSDCDIQEEDCRSLFSALESNPSHLRQLDLSFNPLGKLGISLLSIALQNPRCKLEILKLYSCQLNSQNCVYLATALSKNSSLIELDLSKNALNHNGAQHLANGLRNPACKLKVLSLADCGITKGGCRFLCNALNANPSHLSELCLNRNSFGDSGVECISDFLSKPCCKLKKLSLSYCDVSEIGCTVLASALKRNPSHLKELELTGNQLGDSGRKKLSALQHHQDYRLEKLKL